MNPTLKALTFSSLAVLLALGSLSPMAQATTKVKDMNSALIKAGDDGIMIFLYGVGWDKFGEKRCTQIMNDKGFKEQAGKAIILSYPCYETPTSAQKAELQKISAGRTIPFPKTYPAIIWMDKTGQHLFTIQGSELSRSSSKELYQLIKQKRELVNKHSQLLNEADKAKGLARAKLIGQSWDLAGFESPDKKTLAEIKKNDPKDSCGYLSYYSVGEYDISSEILNLRFDAAQKRVDQILQSNKYNALVKQAAIIAMLGQWRTEGTRKDLAAMRKYAQEVIKLNADNYHAGSARYMINEWFKSFDLATGWFPQILPEDNRPVFIEDEIPIKEKGNYEIAFKHTSGKHGLTVESVTLFDGNEEVACDAHEGFSGSKNKNNKYYLPVQHELKNPRIAVRFKQGSKNESHGIITINRIAP